jgi:hypothetical protein
VAATATPMERAMVEAAQKRPIREDGLIFDGGTDTRYRLAAVP